MIWATPTLAALVAAISMCGCAKNHSLVYSKMSSETIDWKIRNALEDVTSLEDRFQRVGSLTDWASFRVSDFYWEGLAVVPWDSDRQEMRIPLLENRHGGIYNMFWANDEIVIQFDSDGQVTNVSRQEIDTTSDFDDRNEFVSGSP